VTTQKSGVPGLQDIPLVGALFRSTQRTTQKKELVILLKPTVIKSDQGLGGRYSAGSRRLQSYGQGSAAGPLDDLEVIYLPTSACASSVRDHAGHELFYSCGEQPGGAQHAPGRRGERRRLHQDHRRGRHGQKTLLCRKFLATLDDNWVSAYVRTPNLEPKALLLGLAEELGVKLDGGLDSTSAEGGFEPRVAPTSRARSGAWSCASTRRRRCRSSRSRRCACSPTSDRKRKLRSGDSLRAARARRRGSPTSRSGSWRQRITFQHHMGTLTREETEHYLVHRLAIAGYSGDEVVRPGGGARDLPRKPRRSPLDQHPRQQGADARLRRGHAKVTARLRAEAGVDTPALVLARARVACGSPSPASPFRA